MAARLVVQFQGAEFGFDLRGESVRVGSASSNGLVLRDAAVGKEHFEIRRMGPTWRLVDLESATGTRVNGLFVNKHDLRTGDVIAVGEARLTFQADDSVAPAPLPGAPAPAPLPVAVAPLPVPMAAPAPWAAAPAAAPPWASPGAPQALPAPRHAPPPRNRGSRRDQERGYRRDQDDDRQDRQRRGRGGGGSAGGAVGIVLGVLLLFVAGGLALKYGLPAERKDPNPGILAAMKAEQAKGNFDEAIRLADDSDQQFDRTRKPILYLAGELKIQKKVRAEDAAVQEAEQYFQDKVAAYRAASPDDSAGIALRCDDFLQRYPDNPHAEEASFLRMRVTGEPSPAVLERRRGATGGVGGFVSWSDLTRAAEAEAQRFLDRKNYAAAFNVYDRMVNASPRTVVPEFKDRFMEEVNRCRAGIDKKARKTFETFEEDSMVIEDRGNIAEVEDAYRKMKDTIGIPELRNRCEAELVRLQGVRRR